MIVIILLSLAVTQNIGRLSEQSSGADPQKRDIDAIGHATPTGRPRSARSPFDGYDIIIE